MHGRTTLQAPTLTLPLCCKSMWKYQNYVISSSRKVEGGNLEQQVNWNSHAGQKAVSDNSFFSHPYCLHEVGVQQSPWQVWQTLFHKLPSFCSQKNIGEKLKPATHSSKPCMIEKLCMRKYIDRIICDIIAICASRS